MEESKFIAQNQSFYLAALTELAGKYAVWNLPKFCPLRVLAKCIHGRCLIKDTLQQNCLKKVPGNLTVFWVVLDTVPFSGHKHLGSQSLGLWLVLQELSIGEAVFFQSLKSSEAGCSSLIMKYVPSTLPTKLNIEPVEQFFFNIQKKSIHFHRAGKKDKFGA